MYSTNSTQQLLSSTTQRLPKRWSKALKGGEGPVYGGEVCPGLDGCCRKGGSGVPWEFRAPLPGNVRVLGFRTTSRKCTEVLFPIFFFFLAFVCFSYADGDVCPNRLICPWRHDRHLVWLSRFLIRSSSVRPP